MKKILSIFMSALLISFSVAADVDHFAIEVTPNPVKVNEAADVTVKVIGSDGNIVKDYDGTIIMQIKKGSSSVDDATLPGDEGMYKFQSQDKGVKKFSKGLKLVNKGEYSFVINDLLKSKISSEEKVSVSDGDKNGMTGSITLTSPERGSTENGDSVKVVGSSTFPNSPAEIYMDETKVKETTTDENGDFNDIVDSVSSGAHILQLKIVNVDGSNLAESDPIDFTLENNNTSDSNFYKKIEILPSNTVSLNDKVVVNLETVPGVTSAKLDIQGMGTFVMDKASDGKFTKNMVASKVGQFPISVSLTLNGNTKNYPNIEKLTVLEQKIIKNVRYEWSTQVDGDVNLSWQYSGTIAKFKVAYGTGNTEDALKTQMVVTGSTAVLHSLSKVVTYYAKVYPLDASGNVDGISSDIISITYGHGAAAQDLCVVKGIKITPVQEGDKYYITWDAVPDTEGYIVYKSDSDTTDITKMQKVAETKDTRYEYPFDHKSKKDTYAYYAVQAKCKTGQPKQIDGVKKVKVGPMDNILIMMLLSVVLYGGYKMYRFTKE